MAKTNTNITNNGLTKSQAENVVTIRVLLLVLFDIAVSFLFDFFSTSTKTFTAENGATYTLELVFHNILPVLRWVFGILFVLSLAYFVIARVKKINTSRHPVTPEMLVVFTFILTAAVVFYDMFKITPFLFYTMTVVISVLVAIYYIYTMLFY
ncbi:MAG: hypothetical protein E7638_03250 [Ruminococcaceae bacterium]|nr:hypothetical protein [Oscillospiraceae bacterium]